MDGNRMHRASSLNSSPTRESPEKFKDILPLDPSGTRAMATAERMPGHTSYGLCSYSKRSAWE